MKYLFLALLALLVSGCSVFQQPVIQTKLVYIEPPIEITIKPEKIKSLDPEKATEKDFSNWVIDNFYRFKQIETNFDALVEWNKQQASLVNQ